mgnify:CR=1 FL=1
MSSGFELLVAQGYIFGAELLRTFQICPTSLSESICHSEEVLAGDGPHGV